MNETQIKSLLASHSQKEVDDALCTLFFGRVPLRNPRKIHKRIEAFEMEFINAMERLNEICNMERFFRALNSYAPMRERVLSLISFGFEFPNVYGNEMCVLFLRDNSAAVDEFITRSYEACYNHTVMQLKVREYENTMAGYFKSFDKHKEQMSEDNLRRLRSLKICTTLGIDMNSAAEIIMVGGESN